jgi:hypothetical protein
MAKTNKLKKRFHPNSGLDTLPVLNSNVYMDNIPLVTPKEAAKDIRNNLNPKRASGFYLIPGESLGQTECINQCLYLAKLYCKCMENC